MVRSAKHVYFTLFLTWGHVTPCCHRPIKLLLFILFLLFLFVFVFLPLFLSLFFLILDQTSKLFLGPLFTIKRVPVDNSIMLVLLDIRRGCPSNHKNLLIIVCDNMINSIAWPCCCVRVFTLLHCNAVAAFTVLICVVWIWRFRHHHIYIKVDLKFLINR